MHGCRCRIKDWRAIRLALGWSVSEMARRLGIGRSTVYALETPPEKDKDHHCYHRAQERLLRAYLMDPALLERLRRAGVPDPFPEDRRDAGHSS